MKIKLVWSLQYKLVTISTISTSKYCMLICRLSRCRLVFTIHHFVRINLLIIIAFLVNTKKYQHHTVSIHSSALCPYSERNSRRNNGCMEPYTGCLVNPGHCQSLSPESVFVSDLKKSPNPWPKSTNALSVSRVRVCFFSVLILSVVNPCTPMYPLNSG